MWITRPGGRNNPESMCVTLGDTCGQPSKRETLRCITSQVSWLMIGSGSCLVYPHVASLGDSQPVALARHSVLHVSSQRHGFWAESATCERSHVADVCACTRRLVQSRSLPARAKSVFHFMSFAASPNSGSRGVQQGWDCRANRALRKKNLISV